MKGVTHYFFAAALASLIPTLMIMAVYEKSFIIVLAAIAGILPDYIDFKIVRFLWRVDEEIIPEWPIPNASRIAEKIAKLIDEVWEKKKVINVQIHTIKTGPSTWRKWFIYIDPDRQRIKVGIGPIQTFGGRTFDATIEEVPPDKRVGEAKFSAPLRYGYKDRTIEVSILTGPMVAFAPTDDHVEVVFLPWHRYASHSIILAGGLSSIVFLVALLFGISSFKALMYSIAFFVGYTSHILSDQFGHMGSNLFWPFTKKRIEGLKITESADPYANFLLFWLSTMILLWQMNSAISPKPITFPWTYTILGVEISIAYLLFLVAIPSIIIIIARVLFWKPRGDPYLRNLLREEYGELFG